MTVEFLGYTYDMPRPKKPPQLRMDTDLRIPVTADQKALITQAAKSLQYDMAGWARQVLLDAAKAEIAKSSNEKAE